MFPFYGDRRAQCICAREIRSPVQWGQEVAGFPFQKAAIGPARYAYLARTSLLLRSSEKDRTINQRPPITRSLTAADFSAWYWLKTELVTFCRLFGLTTGGSKLDLEARIRGHLTGFSICRTEKKRKTVSMPSVFTLETLIAPGWTCNPALGAFFRSVCGNGFRFNAAMRDFIHNGSGRTLADAAICYSNSVKSNAPKQPIARQLEYNQHFRDFFAAHPKATRQDAIDAWWLRRSKRKTVRRRAES